MYTSRLAVQHRLTLEMRRITQRLRRKRHSVSWAQLNAIKRRRQLAETSHDFTALEAEKEQSHLCSIFFFFFS